MRSIVSVMTGLREKLLMLPGFSGKEIMAQQARYRAQGGTFMIPIPELRFEPKDIEIATD